MSNTKQYILWFFSLALLLFSGSISQIKPQFIYDTINTSKLQSQLQYIVDQSNQQIQTENTSGIERIVFINDSITFWSSNKIDFEALSKISETGVYWLSSRIYLIWDKQKANERISYFIPLKNNFDIENTHLRNTSFKHLSFPINYTISKTPTDIPVLVKIKTQDFNLYFEKTSEDSILTFWKYLLAFSFSFSILFFLILIYKALIRTEQINTIIKITLWVSSLLIVYFFIIPAIPFSKEHYLFQPFSFANSYISSMSNLFIISTLFFVSIVFILRVWQAKTPKFTLQQAIIGQYLASILLVAITLFISNILTNSTNYFTDFQGVILQLQDISILLTLGILCLSYVKILIFIIKNSTEDNKKLFYSSFLSVILPLSIVLVLIDWHLIIISVFILLNTWIISFKNKHYFSSQTVQLILIFIASTFLVTILEYNTSIKELNVRKLLLENYQSENNRLEEFLIEELDTKITQDTNITQLINHLPQSKIQIQNYIVEHYLTGFWSQYKTDFLFCNNSDSINNTSTCNQFFKTKLSSGVKKITNTHFVVHQEYGINHYLGKISYHTQFNTDLYIMLRPKKYNKNLGYPSILLSNKVDKNKKHNNYSYAKYVHGELASHTGTYNYTLNYHFPTTIDENQFYVENNYHHLINKQADGVYNIISIEKQSFWTFLVVLSYAFVLYLGVFYFISFLNALSHTKLRMLSNLKDKLRLSFLLLLVITFGLITWGTISKSKSITEINQQNFLEEKMQSVLVELKHKLSKEKEMKIEKMSSLNFLLTKFSNVFFTDINIYSLSGKLIASSRPEVFEKGLIGDRMNPKAFDKIAQKNQSKYIHNEYIGTQKYYSSYIALKNPHNKVIAYLNLPYFTKDKEIKEEFSSIITSFLNIFIILFLITGLLTIFISNRITMPLAIIQSKLKDFKLGEKNETINYKSNDEIGALVKEYNKTILELNKSTELLAQKEREGAWKEMAKQIAHEIKNPLTPMKLSIQHLKYVWKDDKPNKEEKINKTVDLIVKQIDNLAEIADAFSNFSKMTTAHRTHFSLINLIQELVELHTGEVAINLIYDKNNSFNIFADEQQIARVFQNILTNAIQAKSEERSLIIEITIEENKNNILTHISDNGKGMDSYTQKRIFEPNFTTKNSGMGLGLAIVKQIVKNNFGDISFTTKENEGTIFKIDLPKQG